MFKTIKKFLILIIFILTIFVLCACQEDRRSFNPKQFIYHDEVAWVQLYKSTIWGSQNAGIVCIDRNGMEIFSMPDIQKNKVSNFYNDKAIIENRYIINKHGEILNDLYKEFGGTVKIFPSNYYDGFIFMEKQINNIWMTGLLNESLEWIIEPTTKLNNIEEKGNFLYYNTVVGYYDALENEFINEDDFKYRKFQRCFQQNGLIFLTHKYSYDENYFIFYDAYIDWEMATNGVKYVAPYMVDYEYGTYNNIARGNIRLLNAYKTGFYNKDCELIIDLSEYKGVIPLSNFVNNKCLIQFVSAQNGKFVGLINLDGDFLFLKPKNTYEGFDTDKIEFNDCYFDWNGICFIKEDKNS